MKNFARVLIALVLVLSLSFSLIACNKSSGDGGKTDTSTGTTSLAGTYDITVWCAEKAVDLTKKQIADYNASEYAKTNGIVINATVNPKSEADAATDFIAAGAQNAPDIYCFAQDQFARLVQAGGLGKLGTKAAETVKAANDAGVVGAATAGNELYAYPLTSDNGYFMFYDKSVIKESSIGSLEAIIKDCEDAGKYFAFQLEGSAWYNAGFFFGTGCVSEWKTDDKGEFVSVKDNFNSAEGLIAAKGMYKLLSSDCFLDSSTVSAFDQGAAVVVSGTWDYETASATLAGNLGCAKLPTYKVDGKEYQIGSFNGCKLMGVKPQTDAKKSAVCHNLAQFLTDYDRQVERFNSLSWGPANKQAQQLPAVQANPGLAALLAQNQFSVPQGQIHNNWWGIAQVVASSIAESNGTDAELQTILQTYEDNIAALVTLEK